MEFSENARIISESRYTLEGETLEDMYSRVASALAGVEENQEQYDKFYADFYHVMVNKLFTPAGRTLTNAGTEHGIVANCVVLPLEDSMESITQTLGWAMILQQQGCGLGIPIDKLRPAGDKTKTSNGVASGPVSFLRIYDSAFGTIKQQGRHGANMAMMRIDHPDILDFITCKRQEGDITNFNISVKVTNDFMEKLHEDPNQEWLCNWEGEVRQPRVVKHVTDMFGRHEEVKDTKISVGELWEMLLHHSWRNGEPGIAFIDHVNHDNPLPGLGDIECSNPCVTEDTWVQTLYGPMQVKDLIGQPFTAMVNGRTAMQESYISTKQGFFHTGRKRVYELVTQEGYTLKLTKDHEVLTHRGMVPAGELEFGDKIVINRHENNCWGNGQKEFAYLAGQFIGDGSFQQNSKATVCLWNDPVGVLDKVVSLFEKMPARSDYNPKGKLIPSRGERRFTNMYFTEYMEDLGVTKGNKTITPQIESKSSGFYREFLQGLFDADGTVNAVTHSKTTNTNVRLWQKDKEIIQAVQRMLLRLGIYSVIYQRWRYNEEKNFDGGKREDYTDGYELIISKKDLEKFAELIGFADEVKMQKLNDDLQAFGRYNRKFHARFQSLKPLGEEDVYDCTINDIHQFDANGLVVSNCGEQFLHGFDNCNLGSINLNEMVNSDGTIDLEKLTSTVHVAVRMLDNTIELFSHRVPEINEMALANRRIGLGVMGFADMLFKMRITYGTPKSIEVAHEVMEHISTQAKIASQLLGRDKGSFPNKHKSIYVDVPHMRNSSQTSIAPTGSICMLYDVNGGIEPYFKIGYIKKVRAGEFEYFAPEFDKALSRAIQESEQANPNDEAEIKQRVLEGESLFDIWHDYNYLPEWIPQVFVTSMEVSGKGHVHIQQAFQAHTTNSISKTTNLPESATIEEIDDLYREAWNGGLKSLTVYRDNSRENQVLNSVKVAGDKDARNTFGVEPSGHHHGIIDRPRHVEGSSDYINTGYGKMYVVVNHWEHDGVDNPYEVFAMLGKEGSDTHAYISAITRLISLTLRSGTPMVEVVKQLSGIAGNRPVYDEGVQNLGPVDALSQILRKYADQPEPIKLTEQEAYTISISDQLVGECPMGCGGQLVYQQGCAECPMCDWSQC